MNVRDEDEVGFGQASEFGRLGGIEVDGFASGLDEDAGVVEGSDFDLSGSGRESSASVR